MITVDGVRLEARRIAGPADKPVLVFLHEGLGSMGLWRDFPDRVAEAAGLAALIYSRQGYGGSDPVEVPRPLDYMQREGSRVLPRLLEAEGITRSILVGHSDGASIAIVAAGSGEARGVEGLVLMAPHVFVEDMCIEAIGQTRAAYEQGGLRERLARHHGANVDCAFSGWNRAWLDPGFKAWDIRSYLAGIRVPTLVIQGEDDEYGTHLQYDAIRGAVPGCRVAVLPDCGHSPQKDQPQATLAAILGLVRAC